MHAFTIGGSIGVKPPTYGRYIWINYTMMHPDGWFNDGLMMVLLMNSNYVPSGDVNIAMENHHL